MGQADGVDDAVIGCASRAARRVTEIEKALVHQLNKGFYFGGVDGTRTRDPRRDRPVF